MPNVRWTVCLAARDSAIEARLVPRLVPPDVIDDADLAAGGYSWKVKFDPAPAIDHTLHHAELGAPLSLGTRDAHFTLPILRWEEVRSLGSRLGVRERLLLCSTAFVGRESRHFSREPVGCRLRGEEARQA